MSQLPMKMLTALILVAGLMPAIALAEPTHTHGTAGFALAIPAGWAVRTHPAGLELTQGEARIAIDNLNIQTGTPDEALTALTAPAGKWNPRIKHSAALAKPYPGKRAVLQTGSGEVEMVVLQTPIGLFMASIEPSTPAARPAFDAALSSFRALDAAHLQPGGNLPQYASLGAYEVAMPDGVLDRSPGYLAWKSPAHGTLTVELVRRGKAQPLSSVLDQWESQMQGAKATLAPDGPRRSLLVQSTEAMLADYRSPNMRGRVEVLALDAGNALRIALVTRKETFDSHQALLDAVGFSVLPAEASASSARPTQKSTAPQAGKAKPRKAEAAAPAAKPEPPSPGPADAGQAPESGDKKEKSLWEKMSDSIKKGSGKSTCSDAERSLNQCR